MSESEEVGSIVAYLTLNRAAWVQGIRATEADAKKLGSLSPDINIDTNAGSIIIQLQQVRAASDTVARQSPNVRVTSNAQEQIFEMHALRDAIVLIGPAAVPIAAVAGGALLGLVPAIAAVALGIKGISDAQKSGELQGTKYAQDLSTIKSEATQLKQIAAGGLLAGIDQGLGTSAPLFKEINTDIGDMSGQLGHIIGSAGPAFLTIFTQLNPLFETFGLELVRGADGLEVWANKTYGVKKFVSYVQAELPTVEHDVGAVLTAFVHLTAGLAPVGLTALRSIGMLATAIDLIPINDLSKVETTLVAGYAAWRTYGAVSAAVAAQSAASTAKAAAAALVQKSIDAQVANAKAQEAAKVATAQAEEDEALAAGALAAQKWGASFDAAAIQVAAASRAAATAAVASAEETEAAQLAAASAVEATIVTTTTGFGAIAAPLAAAAVGVGLLTSLFDSNDDAAKSAAAAADSYAQSVQGSTDALSAANVAQTNKNLSDKGALKTLSDLNQFTGDLKVSNVDLALAVNGTGQQYDNVITKLKAFIALHPGYGTGQKNSGAIADQVAGAMKLISVIQTQRKGLQDQILTQTQLNQLNAASIGITDDQAVAGAKLFGLVGTTGVAAYLAAKQAAQQSTQQTQAQTLAWQLANDAGSLLQQTLDKLSGKKISYAQTENQFEQSILSQAKNLASGSKTLSGLGEDAISNRSDLLQEIQAAEQAADAYGELTGSSVKAKTKLADLRQQIIDNAVAHGEDKAAVTAYVDSLLTIPKTVPPTKLDAETTAADKKVAVLQAQINALKQIHPPNVGISNQAKTEIAQLQIQIDELHGKAVPISLIAQSIDFSAIRAMLAPGYVPPKAAGGGVDDGWFTVGEQGYELGHKQGSMVQIYSHPQAKKMLGTGDTLPGYDLGTVGRAGDIVTPNPAGSNGVVGANGKTYSSATSAANAQLSALQSAESQLTSFITEIRSLLGEATSGLSSSFTQLAQSAKAAGASQSELATINREEVKLSKEASQYASIAGKLGTAPTAPTAYDKLATAQGNYNQEQSSVSGAVSGTFNVATAGQNSYGEPTTLFDITSQLAVAVANAKKFASVLKQLAKEGLNKTLLDQLAQAGPAALSQAEALLSATPAQLKSINSEEGQLQSYAAATGKTAAQDLYGAGVAAAQGLVNGLKSQEKTIAKEMTALADVMVNQIKKDLKIHSPSQVAHELGEFVGAGFANGIQAKTLQVSYAASKLGRAGLPSPGGFVAPDGTVHWHYEPHFHNAVPETSSTSNAAGWRRMAMALGR